MAARRLGNSPCSGRATVASRSPQRNQSGRARTKASAERDAAIESGEGYKRMIKASNDRIDEQRATLRKYEEDIAKLRTAIGDLQFKEILGRVEKGTESR